MKGDVWCHRLRPVNGAWTVRPRNAWRPWLYFALVLRRYDMQRFRPPLDRGLLATAWTYREEGTGWRRRYVQVQLRQQDRTATVQLYLDDYIDKRQAAADCLRGTGYPPTRAERLAWRVLARP